ncbi:MAG: acyltransferase family protein [Fidelibacterota bacterium]
MKQTNRFFALDVFRGMTIALMILVNNPGSWSYVYAPFRHAHWHGCTPTDLVFPFFLFIVGVAMRFSFSKFDFKPSREIYSKIFWRTVTIFVFGFLLGIFPFIRQDWNWGNIRIMGVLQRIALAYGISAVLVIRFSIKDLWKIIPATLIAYWLIMWGFGGPDPYSLEGNLIRKIDMFLLGSNHLWRGTGIPFDPEGLFSTISSVITVLFGYMAGVMIQTAGENRGKILKNLAITGSIQIIVGLIWSIFMPINKALWTSSYVVFTAGIATLVLTGLIWVIDIKGYKKIFQPFIIYGTNSIFVFVGSGLWAKTILKIKFSLNGEMVSGYSYLYKTIFQPMAGNMNGSLLFALTHVLMWWLILYWLYRKKIFIRI